MRLKALIPMMILSSLIETYATPSDIAIITHDSCEVGEVGKSNKSDQNTEKRSFSQSYKAFGWERRRKRIL
ncbi:MAG: hypothetical protein EAX81_00630 [Candidatus Thorarchaeota archaeon]|nr:hypothetical protein [Candidatus Thorarchaeota archaeon]